MQNNPLADAIAALLNKERAQDLCNCERCRTREKRYGPMACTDCGYSGPPVSISCACYDNQCGGGNSRGAGCFHGAIACPVCDSGEADPWEILRAVRELINNPPGSGGEKNERFILQ